MKRLAKKKNGMSSFFRLTKLSNLRLEKTPYSEYLINFQMFALKCLLVL